MDKAEKALSLLKGALDYSDFRDVDMVIEVCKFLDEKKTILISLFIEIGIHIYLLQFYKESIYIYIW